MLFRQIIHNDLGCASYLVGDEKAGVAAVVDPQLRIEEYLQIADFCGVTISHVLETHTHADHISGRNRLVQLTGATVHIHHKAAAQYDHEPIGDNWTLSLGQVQLQALHTPGHRPEHTAFAISDFRRGPQPWAILTGDTLFVGDIGRPDLAVDAEEGAHDLFRSLQRILSFSDEVEVWPGHLGGSLCGGGKLSLKISSTIGFERAHNSLLQEQDPERFVEVLTTGLGAKPGNFEAIVDINAGRSDFNPTEPMPISVDAVADLVEATARSSAIASARSSAVSTAMKSAARATSDSAVVVDVRSDVEFDRAHIPRSISIPLRGSGFAGKVARVVGAHRDIVFVADDEQTAITACRLTQSVGLRGSVSYLVGGFASWLDHGHQTRLIKRLDVPTLHARFQHEPVQILDVRELAEREQSHIPGSVHCPFDAIDENFDSLDRERPIAVICAAGPRSGTAASLLHHYDFKEAWHVVDGGVDTWLELQEAKQRHTRSMRSIR